MEVTPNRPHVANHNKAHIKEKNEMSNLNINNNQKQDGNIVAPSEQH